MERISALRCSVVPFGNGFSTNTFTPGVTSYMLVPVMSSFRGLTSIVYDPGAAKVGAGEPESLPPRPCGVDGTDGAIAGIYRSETLDQISNDGYRPKRNTVTSREACYMDPTDAKCWTVTRIFERGYRAKSATCRRR